MLPAWFLCLRLCTITVNYPYDAVGTPDTRPGTWGTAGYDDGRVTFAVPDGYRVRVLRITGNFTARMHGDAKPDNLYAGALFGIITTASGNSPLATNAQDGCLLYVQVDVNSSHSQHVEFDWPVDAVLPDGVMVVRRAVYLNELPSVALHSEPSFVVAFRIEPIQK